MSPREALLLAAVVAVMGAASLALYGVLRHGYVPVQIAPGIHA